MRLTLLILVLSLSNYCDGQIVYTNRDRLIISDTSCFYNKNYYLVESTTNRKIDLSILYKDSILNIDTGIKINSFFLEQLNLNKKIQVRLSNDSTSIYPTWSLFIDMKDDIESYTLIPIYCKDDFLVLNVIGVQKARKNKIRRGYLKTLVYRVG